MTAISGPAVLRDNLLLQLDSKNKKSYNNNTSWYSLAGGHSVNVSALSYSLGFLSSDYKNTSIPSLPLTNLTSVSFSVLVSSDTNSRGTIFNIRTSVPYIYSALYSSYHAQTDGLASISAISNTNIGYSTTIITSHTQTDSYSNVTQYANIGMAYTTYQNTSHTQTDNMSNVSTSSNNIISYNATANALHLHVPTETININIDSMMDNYEQNIELGIKNSMLVAQFKYADSEVTLLEGYNPNVTDLITLTCNLVNNTYTISMYINSDLVRTESVATTSSSLPGGALSMFSSLLNSRYSNIPIRIFNIYDTKLSSYDVLNLSSAIAPY